MSLHVLVSHRNWGVTCFKAVLIPSQTWAHYLEGLFLSDILGCRRCLGLNSPPHPFCTPGTA